MASAYELIGLPQFRGVPFQSIQDLVRRAELATFDRGERLFRQGDRCRDAWLVVSGGFEVSIEGSGVRRAVGQVGQGEVAGEAALFLPDAVRSATLEATEPTVCLVLTRRMLLDDREHPALIALETWLLRSMAHRLRATSSAIQRGWSNQESLRRDREAELATPSEPLTEEQRQALRLGTGSRRDLLRELVERVRSRGSSNA